MSQQLNDLCDELAAWSKVNNLECRSADEMMHALLDVEPRTPLIKAQVAYLQNYIERWDAAEDADRAAHTVVSSQANDEARNAKIAALTALGFSWEYPGFADMDVNGFQFTVSVDEGDVPFTCQGQTREGGAVSVPVSECQTIDEVKIALERFRAEVLPSAPFYEAAGFTPENTGGGCMAFYKDRRDGTYMLITVTDDAAAPETSFEPVTVGHYDEGTGEQLSFFEASSGAEALKRIADGEFDHVADDDERSNGPRS